MAEAGQRTGEDATRIFEQLGPARVLKVAATAGKAISVGSICNAQASDRRASSKRPLRVSQYGDSGTGNYQIAAITALMLLVPSIAFMVLVERFLNTEMLARIG